MYNQSSKRRIKKYWDRKIFKEIMEEFVPNIMKNINPEIKESQQNPHRINTTKTLLRYIKVKVTETKEEQKNPKTISKMNTLYTGK